MLVINSEQFTIWESHYARLQEVFESWEPRGGRLLTLGRSRLLVSLFLRLPCQLAHFIRISLTTRCCLSVAPKTDI